MDLKGNKEEILKKKARLEEVKNILKEEFVGIDNIIDNVINSISPFYIFPNSIKRPIVINLWGMTGTGKTSLIERLVELLNQKHCFVKFDIGEYCGSDDKLRTELSTKIRKLNDNSSILLFDEFQLGRTIDDSGKEIDRNTLRPIWELIDTGVIYTHNTGIYMGLVDIMEKMKKCIELGVIVDRDGYVIAKEEVYDSLFRNDYAYVPSDYKECTVMVGESEYGDEVFIEDEESKMVSPTSNTPYWWNDSKGKFKKPKFIKRDMFETYLYDATPTFFNEIKDFDTHKHLFNKTLNQLLDFMQNDFMDRVELTNKVDFSKSVIFCVGNLDELYRGEEHNISPDEDADLFHEQSLDITLPQVKQALSSRFRMEQIGRLGNTHYIYNTLNRASYEKLITKYLDNKVAYVKDNFNITITFDKSINNVLYLEGVYPSQGTRPLLSTFNAMIESYITTIITELSINFDTAETIHWSYDNYNYKLIVKDSNKEVVYDYKVECNLQKLREGDSSQIQALVAVHEAGHALVSCIATKLVPIEVLSKTADLSEGYCRNNFKDLIQTKEFLLKRLQVLLAGIEAEKFVFGNDYCTVGAGSDLSTATNLAFDIIKRYGMDKYPALMSSDREVDMVDSYVKISSGKLEEKILNLLNDAKKEVNKIFKEHEKHLLLLSDLLIQKPKITDVEVKDVLKDLKIDWKEPHELYNFRKVVTDKIKKYKAH